ncbi:MAG TPA: GNAT family N-acetyltransferase [Candidatus Saccharimonadales bacterium]|nr:GNAT family N-acetyltransferase [Candidatus Saccharimonadales bacterium]
MPDIETETRHAGSFGRADMYLIKAGHSYADITYRPETSWFSIAHVHVDPDARGKGVSEVLLRQSVVLAESLDASTIYGVLVSREMIDACVTVFGEDAVQVDRPGNYSSPSERPHLDAHATLRVERQ